MSRHRQLRAGACALALAAAVALTGCSIGDAAPSEARPAPAIDAKAPARLETATFGLG